MPKTGTPFGLPSALWTICVNAAKSDPSKPFGQHIYASCSQLASYRPSYLAIAHLAGRAPTQAHSALCHILQIICCGNWFECSWQQQSNTILKETLHSERNRNRTIAHRWSESKLNSLNNCNRACCNLMRHCKQTKIQLESKLIALLRRNNANAQSNLNACEASQCRREKESERGRELCLKAGLTKISLMWPTYLTTTPHIVSRQSEERKKTAKLSLWRSI